MNTKFFSLKMMDWFVILVVVVGFVMLNFK